VHCKKVGVFMEGKPDEIKDHKSKDKFSDYKAEFAKIVWPTKDELVKQTITVIAVCLMFAVIIFFMDMSFNYGMDIFARLVG